MKSRVRIMVLSSLAILAIATLHNSQQISANLPTTNWHASKMLADGGLPMPPWPNSGNVLLADGGLPMPPWPSSGNVLLADGGLPMPPWPPSGNLVATGDGGRVIGSRDLQAPRNSA